MSKRKEDGAHKNAVSHWGTDAPTLHVETHCVITSVCVLGCCCNRLHVLNGNAGA